MKKYFAIFETKSTKGVRVYETENEMYLDLEFDGITEDNPNVISIHYYLKNDNENVKMW